MPKPTVDEDLLQACEAALDFFEMSAVAADTRSEAFRVELRAEMRRLEPRLIPQLRKALARGVPYCRVCGCTETRGCQHGCYWAEPDLCSECAGSAQRVGGQRRGAVDNSRPEPIGKRVGKPRSTLSARRVAKAREVA